MSADAILRGAQERMAFQELECVRKNALRNSKMRVKSNQLALGDVVAKDVLDISGRMLVPAGTELGANHLRAFKMWGIETVVVESDESRESGAVRLEDLPPELVAEALTQAERSFGFTDMEHPAVKQLFELFVLRLAKEAAGKGEMKSHEA